MAWATSDPSVIPLPNSVSGHDRGQSPSTPRSLYASAALVPQAEIEPSDSPSIASLWSYDLTKIFAAFFCMFHAAGSISARDEQMLVKRRAMRCLV